MISFKSAVARLRTQPPSPTIRDHSEIARKYRYWRVRVMYSTTAGYAVFYLVRNNMSMATKAITDEFGFSNTQWGAVLSAVGLTGLFGYLGAAFCGVVTGMLVDRHGWNAALWLYAASAVIGCTLLATTWNRASPLLAGDAP